MNASERNFSNYQLGDNVYELAGGLLPEIADTMSYDLGGQPTAEALQGFVGHIGPAKWLQDNIGVVRQRLGADGDALSIAADWTERSGIMQPLYRNFTTPEMRTPLEIDTAVIGSGVARWMLRRVNQLRTLHEVAELKTGEVLVAGGSREMKESEHPFVANLATAIGKLPTEAQFSSLVMVPRLLQEGFNAKAVAPNTQVGDAVMEAVAYEMSRDGTVLVVGNAPAGIQSAGQFRLAAQKVESDFDVDGGQLFMAADSLPIARHGEGPATHQNPYTALGQIARNALFLHRNA